MAAARVIGRILSLGYPLPGPLADNYTVLSAPSFFDYDAMVVEPAAAGQLIEAVIDGSVEARTFGGARVRNEPERPGDVALGELLLRRREETATLLANGGAIVCFAHPAVVHAGVAGGGGIDDYVWLPEDVAAACRAPSLVPADGSQVAVVDYQSPLAAFVVGQLANISYRARFEGAGARAFVVSRGGAAVGVELAAARGRVFMLPALRAEPSGDGRYAASDSLQAGIRRAEGVMAEGREPPWAAAYDLPGLAGRCAALEAAREAQASAQRALEAAEAAHDELARFRRLLWQEGSVGFGEVVVEALRLIGFTVHDRDPAAMELHHADLSMLLEIEASERAIDMAPHHRLRQRIEQTLERRGKAPRGLLVVNGERLTPPEQRRAEVSEALRLAAETMRYCIAPAQTLFEAVRAQLAGEAAATEAYRRRLFEHDGVLAAAESATHGVAQA